MSMDIVRDCFDYNAWANQRLLADLKTAEAIYHTPLPISFGSIHQLLHHIYHYDSRYYQKIVLGVAEPSIAKKGDFAGLSHAITELSMQWQVFLQTPAAAVKMQEVLTAKALITLHTHMVYHRGQIHTALSLNGYQPDSLDVYRYRDGQ